jgi:hypothetical protein
MMERYRTQNCAKLLTYNSNLAVKLPQWQLPEPGRTAASIRSHFSPALAKAGKLSPSKKQNYLRAGR